MQADRICAIVIGGVALAAALCGAPRAEAQHAGAGVPVTHSIDQYLMADRSAEIALARSAAPPSIAEHAEVLVLGRHGFQTAVTGTNGFVCLVGRSWAAAADADYGNPAVRVPMCVNAPAARSYLLRVTKITDLAMAGHTLAQVNAAIGAAVARHDLPPMEPGAMCYMMSKLGYGGPANPHWPSHLMFFYSNVAPASWGANQKGSPVLAVADSLEQLTQFVIPVGRWSDGTSAAQEPPPARP